MTYEVKKILASPEVKDGTKIKDAINEVCDGNAVLFVDGEKDFVIIGIKNRPYIIFPYRLPHKKGEGVTK